MFGSKSRLIRALEQRIAEKHNHIHLVQTVSQTVASWLLIGVKEPGSSYFVEIEAKHTKPGKLEFLLRSAGAESPSDRAERYEQMIREFKKTETITHNKCPTCGEIGRVVTRRKP
jgi:hypothetical protein